MAVLYVHKYTKQAAHIADFYYTEEIAVITDNSKIYESHHWNSLS